MCGSRNCKALNESLWNKKKKDRIYWIDILIKLEKYHIKQQIHEGQTTQSSKEDKTEGKQLRQNMTQKTRIEQYKSTKNRVQPPASIGQEVPAPRLSPVNIIRHAYFVVWKSCWTTVYSNKYKWNKQMLGITHMSTILPFPTFFTHRWFFHGYEILTYSIKWGYYTTRNKHDKAAISVKITYLS